MSLHGRLLLSLPVLLVWSLFVNTRERLGPRPIMPRLSNPTQAPALDPMRRPNVDPKTLN
jgi:hypothetical protein